MNISVKYKHLLAFGSVMVVAWALGTFLLAYFWPHFVNNIYRKAILDQGFGSGPVPINTLYTEPQALFAEPLTAQSASGSKLMTTGVNHDTLLTVGWLDLSEGPQVRTCRTSRVAITACSSQTLLMSTSPTSASALPARRRGTTSSLAPAGGERSQAA